MSFEQVRESRLGTGLFGPFSVDTAVFGDSLYCRHTEKGAMSAYTSCTLTDGCNAARGRVLDGFRVPPWPWDSGTKHGVHDGGVHHRIMQFLETQPGRSASFEDIARNVPGVGSVRNARDYVREMDKQRICDRA